MSERWIDGDTQALNRLCAHFGIATDYHDIWGKRHAVTDENLTALLAEFGVDAGTPERIEAAAREVHEQAWRRPLPPVVAIGERGGHRQPDGDQQQRRRRPPSPRRQRWQRARHQNDQRPEPIGSDPYRRGGGPADRDRAEGVPGEAGERPAA